MAVGVGAGARRGLEGAAPQLASSVARPAALPASDRAHRRLLLVAAALAFCVVGLGAYVRLSHAGLGCPDWPGCYGHWLGVPDQAAEVADAARAFPGQPVEVAKAWKEMVHRYAAGILGLLVVAVAVSARRRRPGSPWRAENGLLLLIALQAALGMWTVTLLLKPLVVSLHLLGGMATWAMLVLLLRRAWRPDAALPAAGRLALLLVFAQIALGGWVASHYAGIACDQFPACRDGVFWPASAGDFVAAFAPWHELGDTAAGDASGFSSLVAIQLAHRAGALFAGGVLVYYAVGLRRTLPAVGTVVGGMAGKAAGTVLLAALALQVFLGIATVLGQLPLPLAVAHNLGAAALVGLLVALAPDRATKPEERREEERTAVNAGTTRG